MTSGSGRTRCCAVNPRLIYCSIWAFGYQGPLRLAPGFDPLLQAYGAVMTLTGRPEDPPTFCAPGDQRQRDRHVVRDRRARRAAAARTAPARAA